jgi:hypothetical protein
VIKLVWLNLIPDQGNNCVMLPGTRVGLFHSPGQINFWKENFRMKQPYRTRVLPIRREPKRNACVAFSAALIFIISSLLVLSRGSQNFLIRPSYFARVPRIYTHFLIHSKPGRATLHRSRWDLYVHGARPFRVQVNITGIGSAGNNINISTQERLTRKILRRAIARCNPPLNCLLRNADSFFS